MKNSFIKSGLFMSVLAMALMTGCQKEPSELVTLGIKTEGTTNGTKVIINGPDGNSQYLPRFEGGESIYVNTAATTVTGAGDNAELTTTREDGNTYCAIYPASLVSSDADISDGSNITVTLPAVQNYITNVDGTQKVEMPMGAYISGTSTLYFKNLCSLVKVTVTNSQSGVTPLKIKSIVLTSNNQALAGTGTVSINGSDPSIAISNTTYKTTMLYMGAGVEIGSGSSKSFYMVVPKITDANASQLTFTVNAEGSESEVTKAFTYTKSTSQSLTLDRSMVATVNLNFSTTDKSTFLTKGGFFEVSAGKFVQFSAGNLKYTEDGGTEENHYNGIWSFSENMSDLASIHSTDQPGSRVWNHFGWSTASTYYGISMSTENSHYCGQFIDWGNVISNDWYTLSKDEWVFLLTSRINSIGRYAYATVNTYRGVLLIPNNYYCETIALSSTNNTSVNSLTSTNLESLENAGCVFLEFLGSDNRDYIDHNGYGLYWSQTRYNDNQSYAFWFNANGIYPADENNCFYGASVRLVKKVN